MTDRPLTYLASPYTAATEEERVQRYEQVCRVAGGLMITRPGTVIFCPISHSHPIATRFELPTTWEFWLAQDKAFLECSCKLIVLMLPGWETSTGVQAEIKIAEELGLPIEYITGDPWIK